MSDSPDYDPVLLAWVTPIVTALADVVPAEQLMLVGAQCRDLLHWRFCRGVPPRATNDTDIAGTLNNWDHFEAIRATFRALGSTGHRFLIADRAVDALPFGEVESPTGTTRHPPGNQLMNVHGCTDAYLRADVLPLPGGLTVHLPQPPNYAVLKLHAWLDRSADHDYKDGPDLALVVHWYAGDLDRFTPNQTSGRYAVTTSTYAPPLPRCSATTCAPVSAHRRPPCWRRAPHRPTTTCWPSTSPWVDRASPPPQLRGARWSRRYSTSSRRAPKCEPQSQMYVLKRRVIQNWLGRVVVGINEGRHELDAAASLSDCDCRTVAARLVK